MGKERNNKSTPAVVEKKGNSILFRCGKNAGKVEIHPVPEGKNEVKGEERA